MASAFSHAIAAAALGQAAPEQFRRDWRFWYLAVICSLIPDADVIGFRLGIAYGDLWGHRGMTHSLLFAAALGSLAAARLRPCWKREALWLASVLAVVTASHGFLDAFTNGGLGVAFFSPFDLTRYFFPWQPVEVSPIGIGGFFSKRGLEVIVSEVIWIWLPAAALAMIIRYSLHLISPRRA